uniref:JmjC domain-containing protein n=1 Tax=Odontella aurita TaxID=265563 RepID=A0A7S4IF80_9STRA|mmetsp:Transcript_24205/g.71235  ORF Transcript_24205/g.71235 Transcript_24205/m.71235 type:complete len:310 (+) Transcript_24205:176-1105(+)
MQFGGLATKSSASLSLPQYLKHMRKISACGSARPAGRPPNVPIDEAALTPDCSQRDIANALRENYKSQTPLLVTGAFAKSDPIYLWKSREYLRAAVGEHTLCNVEIGLSYNDPNSERPEISFGEYLLYLQMFEDKYPQEQGEENKADPPSDELIYLAQNDLFRGLRNDLPIPSLCKDKSYGVGTGKLYGVNFWMGPSGVTTPLHYDPLDNLLLQFVGKKKVILFPKSETHGAGHEQEVAWYYTGTDGGQYNTSAVDVEAPDLVRHPLFAEAPPAIECALSPGDALFIPSKWWHHVRSLDSSISANVWWR